MPRKPSTAALLERIGRRLDPNPIETMPKRYLIALVAVTVVTGEFVLVTIAAMSWNLLAGLRNRVASLG